MARRKKRRRKQPAWKKWVRAGLGIAGAVVGGLVATSPLHRGIIFMAQTGDVVQGVGAIRSDIGIPAGQPPDVQKLIGVGVTVAIGVGLIKLFKYVARRV